MARLVIENLTKVFVAPAAEKIIAVQGVNLVVEERELMVLVGPSASGKTTLLRLIAGLEDADSGTISFNGTVLNHIPPQERDIAMVFQNYALYPHLTVLENLELGLRLRKLSRPEVERRVREVSEMLGLMDCLERKPDALSGGQRQRVALGRALARKPNILLLDEPFSGLDEQMRAQTRRDLIQLQRELGLAVLHVTHDQTEAMSLADRIALMHKGAIQQIASPRALYQNPANRFVAEFFGTPPMNFFYGTIDRNGKGLFFQMTPGEKLRGGNSAAASPDFSVPLPGEQLAQLEPSAGTPIVLGIRPEHIGISMKSAGLVNQIAARIERLEELGPEANVHLTSGAFSCVARVSETKGLELNDVVSISFEMQRAHFFDSVTGKKIGI